MRKWLKEEEEIAISRLQEGMSLRDVGLLLRRSKRSVASRNQLIWRLDLTAQKEQALQVARAFKGTGVSFVKRDNLWAQQEGVCECCGGVCYDQVICRRCQDRKSRKKQCATEGCDSLILSTMLYCKKCRDLEAERRLVARLRVQKEETIKRRIERRRNRKNRLINTMRASLSHMFATDFSEVPYHCTRRIIMLALAEEPCENCGYSVTSIRDLHHIIPRADNGKDTLSNLYFVCPNCHEGIHRGYLPTIVEKDRTAFLQKAKEKVFALFEHEYANSNYVFLAVLRKYAVTHSLAIE